MRVIIGLGANIAGTWGQPRQTIQKVLTRFRNSGLTIRGSSRFFLTAAWGPGNQPPYLNGVLVGECPKPAQSLLVMLKQAERAAGRRGTGIPWGPRCLDLDLLDYGGLVLEERNMILPHPRLHLRPFVLLPLVDVSPDWIHPVLRQTAHQLWHRSRFKHQGRILEEQDSPPTGITC